MAYDLNGITDISDFINYGKGLSLSKADLYLKEKTQSGILYNATLILDEYWDFIQSYIKTVHMNDTQYFRYKYRPRIMCIELYGMAELTPLILRVNNMISAMEFDKRTIKIFDESILTFINQVLVLEKPAITKNKKSLNL